MQVNSQLACSLLYVANTPLPSLRLARSSLRQKRLTYRTLRGRQTFSRLEVLLVLPSELVRVMTADYTDTKLTMSPRIVLPNQEVCRRGKKGAELRGTVSVDMAKMRGWPIGSPMGESLR